MCHIRSTADCKECPHLASEGDEWEGGGRAPHPGVVQHLEEGSYLRLIQGSYLRLIEGSYLRLIDSYGLLFHSSLGSRVINKKREHPGVVQHLEEGSYSRLIHCCIAQL